MIDIHSHILPKVDDGSKDIEMSLEMGRQYIRNNINTVIATPHFIGDTYSKGSSANKLDLEDLKKELRNANIPLEVYLGNEIYASMTMLKDIVEGKATSLNGSRYILMELPMYDIPIYLDHIIYELLLKGYIPIIAHPERNIKIREDPNILYKYIKKGALAQLNLPSLVGMYGRTVQASAKTLLVHHMIHFVATDAHTNRTRSPNVKDAIERLEGLVSRGFFEELTHINAQLLIDNQDIPIAEPVIVKEKKNIFRSFSRLITNWNN